MQSRRNVGAFHCGNRLRAHVIFASLSLAKWIVILLGCGLKCNDHSSSTILHKEVVHIHYWACYNYTASNRLSHNSSSGCLRHTAKVPRWPSILDSISCLPFMRERVASIKVWFSTFSYKAVLLFSTILTFLINRCCNLCLVNKYSSTCSYIFSQGYSLEFLHIFARL